MHFTAALHLHITSCLRTLSVRSHFKQNLNWTLDKVCSWTVHIGGLPPEKNFTCCNRYSQCPQSFTWRGQFNGLNQPAPGKLSHACVPISGTIASKILLSVCKDPTYCADTYWWYQRNPFNVGAFTCIKGVPMPFTVLHSCLGELDLVLRWNVYPWTMRFR